MNNEVYMCPTSYRHKRFVTAAKITSTVAINPKGEYCEELRYRDTCDMEYVGTVTCRDCGEKAVRAHLHAELLGALYAIDTQTGNLDGRLDGEVDLAYLKRELLNALTLLEDID